MNTPTTPPTQDTPDLPDAPRTPDTRPDATLADEVFVDEGHTTAPTTTAEPAATAAMPTTAAPAATATATAPAPAAQPEPQWLTGPAPFAIVLGILGLLVALSTLVTELTDWTLPWGDLGPWTVVAAGVVVLLVGAIGLRSSRARD